MGKTSEATGFSTPVECHEMRKARRVYNKAKSFAEKRDAG